MTTMIITDLDDTLIRSDKTISDYTVEVLTRCQGLGIKVVFATARSAQAASAYLDRFAPDAFIGYGGALLQVGETVIQRVCIPADVAHRLIQECLAAPEITGIHAINETVALSNKLESDMRHYQYTDFARAQHNDYLKISVFANDPAAVEAVAAHFPMCDMLRYTGENMYRFANRDAVKWNAVKALAAYYGYGTDACVAFGDDINDLEIIAQCGTGVAVANAIHAVQDAARYMCNANDNDGVATWIDKHLL